MRYIILSVTLFTLSSISAQRTYSDQEIKRLADLGKLWGMLHYFHPKMGTGEIATDSLILSPTASLIADASTANFERCVKDMLSRVNDPSTKLQQKNPAPALLFSASADKPALHKLPDNILYVAFPPLAAKFIDNIYRANELIPAKWDSAKAIILDLRNATKSPEPADYLYGLFWQLQFLLTGNQPTPEVYERSIYHSGLVSQSDARGYPYYAGWRTSHKGGPNEGVGQYKLPKPMVIVYNSYTEIAIVKLILSVRGAGLCKLVYEGNMSDYPVGNIIPVNLSDGLVANLRVSDYLLGNDQSIPLPDFQVGQIKDTNLSGNFINRCLSLLTEKTKQEINKSNLSWQYIPPKPGWYIDEPLPTAEKRLYALYNWWNAVQYLYPHKNLIGRDWDGVLTQYIPQMINTSDSLSYYRVLVRLTNEINDRHTWVYRSHPLPAFARPSGHFPIRLEFVNKKCYVTNKAKDNLGEVNKIQLWDEVTHINNETVSSLAMEKFRRPGSGNENNFFAWMAASEIFYLLPANSVNLRLNSKGRAYSVTLVRDTGFVFKDPDAWFVSPFSAVEMLDGNIGYVKMGSLNISQVDSMMKAFENTRGIIFDIRGLGGYPKGTADRITSYLINVERKAIKYEKPYITYESLLKDANHREHFSETSYKSVLPRSTNRFYKGKVIVLCDGGSISHAEHSIMLFQAVNATTIGSQTVGADGNITQVVFPGGYWASFTGICLLYPDGGQTQRIGVRVNIEIKPTVEGLKAGKDEVLLRAIEFIKKGK